MSVTSAPPIRLLAHPMVLPVRASSEREDRCERCGNRITVGTEGTEYGHARKPRRCPERPKEVDPSA